MNAPDPLKILEIAQAHARNDGRPSEQQDCPNCTRQGLAILPVRYALLPDVKGVTLPSGLSVDGPAVDSRVASYGLRTLRQGYLYVYVDGMNERGTPDKRWDCYAVTPEGCLRGPLAPAAVIGQTGAWSCGRTDGGSHANRASFITIPNATLVSAAYFIFTQDPLSDQTRAELLANKARMQKIDIKAWLGGSLPLSSGAFGLDKLTGHVLEFMGSPMNSARAPFQSTFRDRAGEAGGLMTAMTSAMKGKHADRAMVLALHDRVGIVQELIHVRSVYEGRMAELAQSHARKLFVASAVENLKADFTKRGKQAEWDKTYGVAYKPGEVETFKSEYMKLYKPLESARNAYSTMWCAWLGDAHLGKIINSLNNRYSPNSAMDCVNQTRTIADMLNGTGKLTAEVALWQKWMGQGSVNKDNLLDRAVSGGSASLLAFLATRKDAALPNVVDAFKNLYTAVDEWEKSNQAHVGYIRRASQGLVPAGVDPREWTVRRGEALFEGLHKFYQTMAGNAAQLKAGAAKHVRAAVVAGILYFNVRFKPITQTMTAAELAMDLKETRWGVDAANKLQVVESTPTKRIYQINTTEFMDIVAVDSKRLTVVQFHVAEERTPAGLWVPAGNRSVGGIILPDGFVPVTPEARPNGFMIARKWTTTQLKGGGTALGFSALVLFFQYKAIEDSLQTLGDPNAKDQAKSDARLALIGAAIGAAGALMEGSAAAWQLARSATLPMMTRLAAGGGILGAVSSAVAAWQTGASAWRSSKAGDEDSAEFGYAATASLTVAAFASGAGAGALLTSSGLLLGLGPVGWSVLAIGAIVVSISLLFEANAAKDDPLDAWLKQCLYGTAPEKFNEADETTAFNKIFELPLDAKLVYDTQILGARHVITATVTIPRLQGRRQKYEISMNITTRDGNGGGVQRVSGVISDAEQVQKVLAPGQTPQQLQQIEQAQSDLIRARLLWSGNWQVDAEASRYELTRKVEFNNQAFGGDSQPFVTQASLEVKYWPDDVRNPTLVLPPGGGPGGTPISINVPR